jgi:hypothetical protein
MRGRADVTPTSESVNTIPAATFRRASGALVRRTPRSLVILAAGSTIPVRVSGSAVDVWEMLARPMAADDLLHAVARELDAAPGSIAADLGAALAVLVDAGAVVGG